MLSVVPQQSNEQSELDVWLKEVRPLLDYWCEGVALLVICTLGVVGKRGGCT